MLSPATYEKRKQRVLSIEEEAQKLGIERIIVSYFLYGDFRYTDLKDAIAQAKREISKVQGERAP